MSTHSSPPDQAQPAPAQRARERKRNPFIRSAGGGRVLSGMMLPWFKLRPPPGFGVLTTIGRRSGKKRPRCVRAIRDGDVAYLVAIGGKRAAWVKNIEDNPNVELRIRDGSFTARARELREDERARARRIYCDTLNHFDYDECMLHRPGLPSRAKIKELHCGWFDNGTPLVIELVADRV